MAIRNRSLFKIGQAKNTGGIATIQTPCVCRASGLGLIGGSGAGWEGTAVLHYGSCIKFVTIDKISYGLFTC